MELTFHPVPRYTNPHGSHEVQDRTESSAGPRSLEATSARGHHDIHDLEQHKETIRRLFIDENRSLVDVIEIMKTKYNVTASYVRDFMLKDDRHRLT
jgi:hypothetical protein